MTTPPQDMRALIGEGHLAVTWTPQHIGRYGFHALRCECGCAACVDERTGERILNPADVPRDVHITNMELVGNYAARLHWSDGHSTGLYTWERLAELCPCAKCEK